jgi:hypothetical protein
LEAFREDSTEEQQRYQGGRGLEEGELITGDNGEQSAIIPKLTDRSACD